MVQLPQAKIHKIMKRKNQKDLPSTTFKKFKSSAGLTILETLIAIGIVTVVVGTVVISIINISNYGTSAEVRSVAVNYAQEAVDIVKNIRDNKYCNFFSISYPNNRYYTANCTSGSCSLSSQGGLTWQYKYSSGSKEANATGISFPGLRRSIKIETVPGSLVPLDERRVTVETQWQTKGVPGTDIYKVITDIYKWKY